MTTRTVPARPKLPAIGGPRLKQVGFSMTDQVLSVGGTFLANIALARTESKEAYGMFVLSYSIFTFVAGLHNAAILEPYTVYGSGRYAKRFSEYLRLMIHSNVVVGVALSALLAAAYVGLRWWSPQYASHSLIGLALTVGVLLSGAFLRRVFYVQRQAKYAAGASVVFFAVVVVGLWTAVSTNVLTGFSVFLILAAGWGLAAIVFAGKLPLRKTQQDLLDLEPHYWREHWVYSRWIFLTAMIFQLTNQGYYWLIAGLLSVREVAELKAMYILVTPVDQVFIALNYLVLPSLAFQFASSRLSSLLALWKWYALLILLITGSFAVLVRILGVPAMHLLYAGRFDSTAELIVILGILPLLMGVGHTINAALKAVERPKLVFFGYLSGGAVTFLAGIPLVRHLGLRGAVYGMLLSGLAYTLALACAFGLYLHGGEPAPGIAPLAAPPGGSEVLVD